MPAFTPMGVQAVVENLDGFTKDLGKMDNSVNQVSKSMDVNLVNASANVTSAVIDVTRFVIDLGKAAIDTAIGLGKMAFGLGKQAFDAAVSFESSFAGVIKTTEGLVDEFGDLTEIGAQVQQDFRDLAKEVPIAVEELLAIGEAGGQLGVAQEDLISFTETIAAMGVATNLTQEEAATQFAQIANVMGTTERIGSEAFSRLGSTIVALGNNFATTEADISNFASRIAGAGAIVGLTEADIFGIGAAFSSVGVAAEAGGTAVQKVLLTMNDALMGNTEVITDNSGAIEKGQAKLKKLSDQLTIAELRQSEFTDRTKESTRVAAQMKIDRLTEQYNEQEQALDGLINTHGQLSTAENKLAQFASVAGIEAEKFQQLWEEDASAAFSLFVSGLGEAGDEATTILKGLGLTDQRLTRAFLSLANSGDLLNDTLAVAADAWEDNNALQNEAAQRYATTESQMQIFKNVMKDIGITVGSFVLPIFNDLLGIGKGIIELFAAGLERGGLAEALSLVFDTGSIAELLDEIFPEDSGVQDFVFSIIGPLDNLFESIGPTVTRLQNDLPAAIQTVSAFFTNTLLPILGQVFTWLQTNIPLAIQTVSSFWTDTLIPTLNTVWAFIQEKIIPVFAVIGEWLDQILPIAIDVISTKWNDQFLPMLAALQEAWTEIQPSLAEFWGWLQERLPEAITTVSNIWETVLKPALQATGIFISETLIPILSDIAIFLLENIPIAVDKTVEFWEEVLLPALEVVWIFIEETLIPIFVVIQNWLQENIPAAIETVSQFWEETLKPALQVVWEFIDQNLIPIFNAIIELFEVTFAKAGEIFAALWDNRILPALKDVWSFIDESILPVFKDVWEFVKEKLSPILVKLKEDSIEPLTTALNWINQRVKTFIDNINKLKDAIANMRVPDWAKGGSPPPLANWFEDIANAVDRVASVELPKMAASLEVVTPIAQGAQSAMSGPMMGGQQVMNNNVNTTFNTNVSGNVTQASFEARVLKIVNSAMAQGV